MNINDFKRDALQSFIECKPDITKDPVGRDITDRFFCFVQNDRLWMKNYLDTVAETGNLQVVNSQIAQYICDWFKLKNNGIEVNQPESHLIQSYHELVYPN